MRRATSAAVRPQSARTAHLLKVEFTLICAITPAMVSGIKSAITTRYSLYSGVNPYQKSRKISNTFVPSLFSIMKCDIVYTQKKKKSRHKTLLGECNKQTPRLSLGVTWVRGITLSFDHSSLVGAVFLCVLRYFHTQKYAKAQTLFQMLYGKFGVGIF